ncbi:MAG: thioredoxin family protein [Anaerolineae bacterium]|nr:thioredoxin family protein [Anaerolineae bacterium]
MAMLNDAVREQAAQFLQELPHPVRIAMFTQEIECEFCRETHQLVEEIAGLSGQISLEVYDFVADKEKADEWGVDKIPAIAIVGADDFGVRFYGIPSGYEFTSLLYAIRAASTQETDLSEAGHQFLSELSKPVHLQVFVTPTCPYCPQSVVLAHQLAIASPLVRADMVEATEFPHLSIKYQVMGVPRTVINETGHVEGAAPEPMILDKIAEALAGAEE